MRRGTWLIVSVTCEVWVKINVLAEAIHQFCIFTGALFIRGAKGYCTDAFLVHVGNCHMSCNLRERMKTSICVAQMDTQMETGSMILLAEET